MSESARILLVEDDPRLLRATSHLLKEAGYEVTGAETGTEGLQLAQAQKPDLILLDVVLPDMDGVEVCQRIKGEPALAGCFVLLANSTKTSSDDRADGLEAGADGYIARPISNRELLAQVEAVLRIKRAEKRVAHLNHVLRAMRNVNQLIAREKNRDHLIQGVCNSLVATHRYIAWIALLDEAGGLLAVAEAGLGEEFSLLVEQLERGELTACGQRALAQPEVVVSGDPPSTCTDCPLAGQYSGWRAATVRLEHGGKVYGLLTVSIPAHLTVDEVDEEEQALLQEVAGDIALALHNIELEEERKRAERVLRQERDRTQKYLDVAGVMFVALNAKGEVTLINRKGSEVLGYEQEGIIGENWFDGFLPVSIRDQTRTVFHKLMAGEIEPVEYYENPVLTKGGEERIVAWHNTALKDDEGNVIGTLSSGEDITERQRAEEALRESEQRLRGFINNSPDTIYIFDLAAHALVYFNRDEFCGYSRDELASDNSILQSVHPDDLVAVRKHWQAMLQAAMDEVRPIEYRLQTKGGDWEWIWDRRVILSRDAQGAPAQVLVTLSVVTERKQAEDALRQRTQELTALKTLGRQVSASLSLEQVVQVTLDGIASATCPDLALLFLREGDKLILQGTNSKDPRYTHEETPVHRVGECLCGLAASQGKPNYSRDIHTDPRCTWEECRKAGLRSFAALPLRSGDDTIGALGLASGTRRDFEEQAGFLETLANEVAIGMQNARLYERIREHAATLEQRVAERTAELKQRVAEVEKLNLATTSLLKDLRAANRQLEEASAELRVARDKAQEADQLKSAFLATMSHELRTPLNSIIGFTGIMLQGMAGPLNEEQTKQLDMVRDSARHLLDLINDVLDISKIEAGQLEVASEPFDVHRAIEKAVRTATPLAEEKGLALAAEVAPEVGQINSDWRRVEQIIINLLNNAIKFTEQGEVRIACLVDDGWLVTRVVDTGIGIKPEDMDKLFQPFRQIETGLNRQHEGTGLGLSICKRLVEMLGGEIWAESEWGVGSTFTFTLPL